MATMRQAGLTLALPLFALACGGGTSGPTTASEEALATQECNPLGGTGCITPWPSDLYTIEDSTSETGRRLAIPVGALPTNIDGIQIQPDQFNVRNGWSAAAPMITAFPGGVDPSNLVSHVNYGDSLTDVSPTVVINLDTGELVPHFAEIDLREPDKLDKQALYLRPAIRLDGSTHYAAAIKKTLKGTGGVELEIPAGFQAILDGKTTKHDLLEAARPRYDQIFSALAAHGIDKDDLVVAWDFTTSSDDSMKRDLLAAREATLAATGENGANLTYNIEKDEYVEEGIRRVSGTFSVPLLLSQDGKFIPGTKLTRDSRGMPEVVGMHPVGFSAVIPDCATEHGGEAAVIVYGHGLLGSHEQAAGGSTRLNVKDMCAIAIGTDMRGMSEYDVPNVLRSLNDFNLADEVFDVLVQGVMNHIALVQAIRGPMADSLFIDSEEDSLIDIDKIHYYGLSQGHIFGTTIATYDPHIKRAVLGVGGANYSMMLERSLDWPVYRNTVIGAYDDPLSVALVISFMQMRWDTTGPAHITHQIPGAAVPGPEKQFLLHMALGDVEVPNISTEYQARSMGIPVMGPVPKEVPWGLEVSTGVESSALVMWDFGEPTPPLGNVAPPDNDVHSLTRKQPAAIRQMTHFYETGEIIYTCTEGQPCDCTKGYCD